LPCLTLLDNIINLLRGRVVREKNNSKLNITLLVDGKDVICQTERNDLGN